jgi:hypothetical protein
MRRLTESGGHLYQTGENNLPSQVSGTKIGPQPPSSSNNNFNSSNAFNSTNYSRPVNQPVANSFGQTGISFAKTIISDKNSSSVRVSIHGGRGGINSNKHKGIEFKILQMNLVMAPTAEKSNMMTCELDLSHHMPTPGSNQQMHKRMLSGGHMHPLAGKNSRTLMPNNSKVMTTSHNTAS